MFGTPLNDSQLIMECLVLDWQNAAVWIQQRLIAVNGGRAKVNHGGRPLTVYQKFWPQQVRQSRILPNILTHHPIIVNKVQVCLMKIPRILFTVVFFMDNIKNILYSDCYAKRNQGLFRRCCVA